MGRFSYFLILCFLGSLFFLMSSPKDNSNFIGVASVSSPDPELPVLEHGIPSKAYSDPKRKTLQYSVPFEYRAEMPTRFRIIADDCVREIRLNEAPQDISAIGDGLCNRHTGFIYNFAANLKTGANRLEVVVEDTTQGYYGLKIQSFHFEYALAKLLFALTFVLTGCFFLHRNGVDRPAIGLFVLTAAASFYHFYASDNEAPTNDVGWHMQYIVHIMNHWLNPYSYSPYTLTHPPLYYYVAAALTTFNQALVGVDEYTLWRFISWVCFLAFHVFNVLIVRRFALSGTSYYCAIALVLLWPGNLHLASKINSEAMYYAAFSAALYLAIAWYQDNRQNPLKWAIIMAFIALAIRTNAAIMIATLGTMILIGLWRKRIHPRLFFSLSWLPVWLTVFACLVLSFFGLVLDPQVVAKGGAEIFTYSQGSPYGWHHYLSLAHSFVAPTTNTNMYHGFLEYLLRTSIFGEYEWPSPNISVVFNYLSVIIFWYAMLPWLFAKRHEWSNMLPLVLCLFFSLSSTIYFSLCVKNWASQDARYIYGALVCFVLFFAKSQAMCKKHRFFVLAHAGTALTAAFTLLGLYFFCTNFR